MTRRQFAVIGLGRFGQHVATRLAELGCEVLAIDNREETVREIADLVTHAVQIDATDKQALLAVGIRNIDCAIVAIGDNMEANILVTLLLKELGVKEIVVEALSVLHGKVLEKIGATRVVYPEKDMGIRLAESLVAPNVLDYLEFSTGQKLIEYQAPESFYNYTLRELDIRAKYGFDVIAIRRKKAVKKPSGLEEESAPQEELIIVPPANEIIKEGDILIMFGDSRNLEKLPRP